MSAGNAFATARDASMNGDDEELHRSPRPFKRPRVSKTRLPPLWAPAAQSETSLEVDLMILDYLAFQATKACLESRKARENGSHMTLGSLRNHLSLVDSFMTFFKARHAQYQADPELRLRLLLLKMSTLFTQRFTSNPTTPDRPSLQDLRKANRERAEAFLHGHYDQRASADFNKRYERSPLAEGTLATPLPSERLEQNRAHVLHQLGLPAEDEDYDDAFHGTASCVSLLDILPLFIELSAASSSIHGSSLTERWMHLASEFMLQASLEQFLVCGAKGTDTFDEAFAWGYMEGEYIPQTTTSRGREVNEMFKDDTYATEVEGWGELKHQYQQELADWGDPIQTSIDEHQDPDIIRHLENVASKHPLDNFEASILKFLDAFSLSIAEPVLAQLERGNLDGMTKQETKKFLAQCGI